MNINLLNALMLCAMVCTVPVFSSDQQHPLQGVIHTLAGQKAWGVTMGFEAKKVALDELEGDCNSTKTASSGQKKANACAWIAQQRATIAQQQEAIKNAKTDEELLSVLKQDSAAPFWRDLETYRS